MSGPSPRFGRSSARAGSSALPGEVETSSPGEAWVESPLQLICAIEAASRGLLGPTSEVVFRSGIAAVEDLVDALAGVKLPGGVRLVRSNAPLSAGAGPGAWAIGDAFSGEVQASLLRPLSSDVVILDDGLATLSLIESVAAAGSRSAVRPRARVGPLRRALGLLARQRLRSAARAGRLTAFTALPVPASTAERFEDIGGRLVRHRFEWAGSLDIVDLTEADAVVVGSAMSADGLVSADSYVDWVHGIAGSAERLAYVPHYRADRETTARIAEHPHVVILRSPWPVEVGLRALTPGTQVHCLPSTPYLTLRHLYAGTDVVVVGHGIPTSWWKPSAPQRFRSHVLEAVEAVEGDHW